MARAFNFRCGTNGRSASSAAVVSVLCGAAVVTWLPAAGLTAAYTQGAARPTVRFHHLHYQVGDPSAAMNHAASRLGGQRVLLRGLGVGVRVGETYLLFDRTEGAGEAGGSGQPADRFTAAVSWLRSHGIDTPGEFSGSRLAASVPGESLLHIAFTAEDIDAVRAALAARHARPVRESGESLMYMPAGGVAIEIVRPTDREDAFWCPMHPDVRSPGVEACPICGMTLVAIPPPRLGEYRMDVAMRASADGAMSGLRLVIREPQTGNPVAAFATVHERPFHLFLVGRRLDYFAHVHPEITADGALELAHAAPPGEYMLIADFLPQGGPSQTVQRAVVTPGYSGPLMERVAAPAPGPSQQVVGGLTIRLDATAVAPRKPAALRFVLTDAATGAPVTDLEPFLGAQAHMLLVRADLSEAIHGHPGESDAASVVTFDPVIPEAGTYKLWLQVQRRGRILTAPFVIQVSER